MTAPEMLWAGPARAAVTLLLAHGAGAPMDTPFMTFFAEGLAAKGVRVGRFEFPYMAARRTTGRRKPPDTTETLLEAWRAAITGCGAARPAIGGKSMGGRMASLLADEVGARGLVCLGYPFYGAGRPDKPRTAHLATLRTPTLICQGERDPLGNRAAVTALALSPAITVHWCPDGDHDLKPRKASGRTHGQNLQGALDAAAKFLATLPP
jgi:predicted alpha/beta-hydrolase family hydrolase